MSSVRSFLTSAFTRWPLGLGCLLIILSVGIATQAQSGRTSRQKSTSPPSVPRPSEAAAKPTESKPRPPVLSVLLVNSVNSTKGTVWTSMALKELAARLDEARDVRVTPEKDMSRKDAGKLAQSRKDAYVVWIQFDIDASMATIDRDVESPIVTGFDPGCLFISYVVFAPGSSAVKAQERVYQEGYRAKCMGTAIQPDPQSRPDRQRLPVAQTLEKAAREAADRILNALSLRLHVAFLKKKNFSSGSM